MDLDHIYLSERSREPHMLLQPSLGCELREHHTQISIADDHQRVTRRTH